MKQTLVAISLAAAIAAAGVTDRVRHDSLFGLYEDDHPQYVKKDGTRPLQADWDFGNFTISGYKIDIENLDLSGQLVSTVAEGTAPFVVDSNTLVTNLNADLWDGYQFADYLDQPVRTTDDVVFNTVTVATYQRHVQIEALETGTVANQPTSTDFFTVGGLQFSSSAPAEYVFCQWEIPNDWAGDDIIIEIDWFPDSGAMSGTDTVQWTVEYRAIAEGELINAGNSVTLTGTNDGDNAQYLSIHTPHTMVYNHADQPLTAQDHLYFKISRNTGVANDFAGTVTTPAFEILYNSVTIPTN